MAIRQRILVVDDDPQIRRLLGEYLMRHGFLVDTAEDAEAMFRQLNFTKTDLVILDLMMPGQDGLSACRELRATSKIPVLMLTALAESAEKTLGLECGADDYVGKPFTPQELLARVRAILRRTTPESGQADSVDAVRRFGDWVLDSQRWQVRLNDDNYVQLTAAEFRLLAVFVERPQRILTREYLMLATHDESTDSLDRSVDTLVSRLRQKLGDDARTQRLFRTVRGGGYIFAQPVLKEEAPQ